MRPRLALAALTALGLFAASCGDSADVDDTTTQATSPTSTPDTSTSQPGDRSPVFIDDVQLVFLESFPVQVRAIVSGSLPTPCHELLWEVSRQETTVTLDLWSTADPDTVCIQVLEPFQGTFDIGTFETGDYELTVDGVSYPFTV